MKRHPTRPDAPVYPCRSVLDVLLKSWGRLGIPSLGEELVPSDGGYISGGGDRGERPRIGFGRLQKRARRQGVGMFDGLGEARPTATRFELVRGREQRFARDDVDIDTGLFVVKKRTLCPGAPCHSAA